MKSTALFFYVVSAIFLLGACKYLMDMARPGVFPPKQVIKQRAITLAGGGGICLLIAFIISYIG
ncbi:hypothetical protein [Neobacillus thermocopriae]|uniref:Uncharacterized protein n=1 Tax=Neobacillus thermocopriae TaxID=1215031 RepID=A0A6B3TRW6_9BACI|nr:hypothetical protein [Neobacillus thermocopriae]MED3623039.1 hypothetical protein [Neobacillus thermocopriae]MED3714934.1 hypothetical protein [Neobacillus thermocopriae]NEX79328.1 hypothetical protein [Neobacillus thermocopriae]